MLSMFKTWRMAVPASATVHNTQVFLPSLNYWTQISTTRTGNYTYLKVRLNSVFPASGDDDNLTQVCFKLMGSDGQTVLTKNEYYTLTEGEGYSTFWIQEGYLSATTIYYGFRGINYVSAYANISHDPK